MIRSATLFTLLASSASAGSVLYVDANLTTGMNDGSSWADAFQGELGLQAALGISAPGDQVFVADGLYLPAASGRGPSFNLQTGVEIYGSFQGGEASLVERPPFGSAAVSVLSGDLNGDDGAGVFSENSYHPVRGAGADATAVLDGFRVSGGNADGTGNNDRGGGILCRNGASPTVRNCHFIGNSCTFGGGAGYINAAAPTFTDCVFEDNRGGGFGGAFDIAGAGAVLFDRCVFVGNRASRAGALEVFSTNGVRVSNSVFVDNVATGGGGGGALWIGQGANVTVVQCTIFRNEATSQDVGGVRNVATTTIRNSILWGNKGQAGGQASSNQVTASADVAYSIVQGGFAGSGNLDADPAFFDADAGDVQLSLASPAIDAGDNGAVPTGIVLDLAGASRFNDEPDVTDTGAGGAPVVDLGAYESDIDVLASFCQISANSSGAGAVIGASGSTSVGANALTLVTTGVVPGAFGMYFYGPAQIQTSFGDGLRCVGAGGVGTFRLSPMGQADGAGSFQRALDLTLPPSGSGSGLVEPGSTWKFQLWFRDIAAGGAGFNTSDGLSVTFAP